MEEKTLMMTEEEFTEYCESIDWHIPYEKYVAYVEHIIEAFDKNEGKI